jgi:hypothetical protein
MALYHSGVACQQLTGAEQEIVAYLDHLRRYVFYLTADNQMSHPWRRCLELSNRLRRPALGVPLQGLAAGLHENHDQAGERLSEQQRGEDCKHGDQVRGEAASGHPTQCPPDYRQAGKCEPAGPGQGCRLSQPCEMREQAGKKECESAGRQDIPVAGEFVR